MRMVRDTVAGYIADAQPYTPVEPPADAAPVTNALITADNFAALAVQIMVTGATATS
jgi:hypothetical protein